MYKRFYLSSWSQGLSLFEKKDWELDSASGYKNKGKQNKNNYINSI